MVRPVPNGHIVTESFSPVPLALGLFVSVSMLASLCAKHSRPQKTRTGETNTPKQLMIAPTTRKRAETDAGIGGDDKGQEDEESGILWNKAILMGEKCRPPQFTGVIYYDCSGNRVPEMPRSPRASPMSPLRNFAFAVHKIDKSLC